MVVCIRITGAPAKRAGMRLEKEDVRGAEDWHATEVLVERRIFVLICNDATRFAAAVGPVQKARLQSFADRMKEAVGGALACAGCPTDLMFRALYPLGEGRLARADVRSRPDLGSLNDYQYHFRETLPDGEVEDAAGAASGDVCIGVSKVLR